MEISVTHALFQKQRLSVRTAGWFSGPGVLLNGAPLKRVKRAYLAKADDGREMSIRLGTAFGDPIPTVRIGDDLFRLAKPLRWYEYAWAAIPMLLLFIGGGLGAVAGILGSYSNFRVFRSERGGIAKFALSGVTTVLTVVAFFVAVVGLRLAIGR